MNDHAPMPPPETIEEVLIQVSEAWNSLFRRIAVDMKECSAVVSPAQFYLLKMLSSVGPQRMSELATRLDITQSGCTAIVDRAIASGLVRRERDPSDRRVVWVAITEEGESTLTELQRAHATLVAHYIREMDLDEVEELADLMQQVAKVLRAIKHQDKDI